MDINDKIKDLTDVINKASIRASEALETAMESKQDTDVASAKLKEIKDKVEKEQDPTKKPSISGSKTAVVGETYTVVLDRQGLPGGWYLHFDEDTKDKKVGEWHADGVTSVDYKFDHAGKKVIRSFLDHKGDRVQIEALRIDVTGKSSVPAQPKDKNEVFDKDTSKPEAGIFSRSGQKISDIKPEENLILPLRKAIEKNDHVVLRLDCNAQYEITRTDRVNDIWLNGKTLWVESTPGDKRAKLTTKKFEGKYHIPFVLGRQENSKGNFRSESVEYSIVEDRNPIDGGGFISFGGEGKLEIIDTIIKGGHHGIEADRGGPWRGVDMLIDRSIIGYVNNPSRDTVFEGKQGSPSTGIFSGGYTKVIVKNTVFHAVGYREDGFQNAIGNIYNHPIYLAVPVSKPSEPWRIVNIDDIVVEDCIFSDSAAWAAQLRCGGHFRNNFCVDNGFGCTLPAGSMTGNVVARARRVWNRDGSSPTDELGMKINWTDHGGQGLNIAHMDKDSSPKYLHGPVEVSENIMADTMYPTCNRAPIAHEGSDPRPIVNSKKNYSINWGDYKWGTPLNPYKGDGVTKLEDNRTEEFNKIADDAIESSLSRGRGEEFTMASKAVEAYKSRIKSSTKNFLDKTEILQ